MDQGQPQGNNGVDGWHSHFKKLVGGTHPGFWKFVTCIAAEHQLTEDKLEATLRSQEPFREKRATAARNATICRLYDNRQQMAVQDFLRATAHHLKH